MNDAPLIIDDASEALQQLSPLGRAVVNDACAAVRDAVYAFVASKRWMAVEYAHFADWVAPLAQEEGTISLDPLLRSRWFKTRHLRVSRVLHGDTWHIEAENPEVLDGIQAARAVIVVDDAAATGNTLRFVSNLIQQRGSAVTEVALCACSSVARENLGHLLAGVRWTQFVPGEHRAIHLRDACAYLPFSGRPSSTHPPIATPGGAMPVRVPTAVLRKGLWAHVFADYRVLTATIRARIEVAARLSAALGREATVADLPLIGDGIALPAYPRHEITPSTTLTSIS